MYYTHERIQVKANIPKYTTYNGKKGKVIKVLYGRVVVVGSK